MIKLKLSYSKIFCYFNFLIIFFGIIILIFVFLFLHKNFYKTITQSQEILLLSKEVAMEDVDMDKFKKVIKRIEEKIKPRSLNKY